MQPCLQASALALRKVPEVNASWHPEYIRQYHNVDCSVAVQVRAPHRAARLHACTCAGASKHAGGNLAACRGRRQCQLRWAALRSWVRSVTGDACPAHPSLTARLIPMLPADPHWPDGSHREGRRQEGPVRHCGRGQGAGGTGEQLGLRVAEAGEAREEECVCNGGGVCVWVGGGGDAAAARGRSEQRWQGSTCLLSASFQQPASAGMGQSMQHCGTLPPPFRPRRASCGRRSSLAAPSPSPTWACSALASLLRSSTRHRRAAAAAHSRAAGPAQRTKEGSCGLKRHCRVWRRLSSCSEDTCRCLMPTRQRMLAGLFTPPHPPPLPAGVHPCGGHNRAARGAQRRRRL